MNLDDATRRALFDYLLRIGDDQLVLGHRLSELCGHGPILEEDIALTNIALDCVGQAQALLTLAGEVEGRGRSADDLAYFRGELEYLNCLLVEQPNGDFGDTIARQFLFDAYAYHLFDRLQAGAYEPLAAIAAKALKETRYHLRHSADWIVRLGDGTEESRRRIRASLEDLWRFTSELFEPDDTLAALTAAGIVPDHEELKRQWRGLVEQVFAKAGLELPEDGFAASGGRRGRHTEHLGHMLSDMQILARSMPGVEW